MMIIYDGIVIVFFFCSNVLMKNKEKQIQILKNFTNIEFFSPSRGKAVLFPSIYKFSSLCTAASNNTALPYNHDKTPTVDPNPRCHDAQARDWL